MNGCILVKLITVGHQSPDPNGTDIEKLTGSDIKHITGQWWP